jgi:large subunit ribosomal protein L21
MFAIIASGGKQYRVREGDVVRLEKLEADAGAMVEFPVLMLGGDEVRVGSPLIDGATVSAEVVAHGRGDKIHVRKYKAKTNYRRHIGHRQPYTEVRITGIKA